MNALVPSIALSAPRVHRAAALAAVIAVAALYGCGREAAPGGRPGMPGMGGPSEVNVYTVQAKTVPATFQYTAQIAGSREVEVRARVTGILQKRNYVEGSAVKQGQSLYSIDPVPLQSALARAEADAAGAEARLDQAKKNAARLKPLFEANAVSRKEFDDATSAELIADADVKSARARITDAKLNVDYTRVESPIAGIASRSQVSEGTLVSGPAVLLTTVSQIDPVYVYFGVSESEHLKLRSEADAKRLALPAGGRFDVSVKTSDGRPYAHTGKLSFSDIRISTATGTSDSRAELPNPEGLLRPGQFVQVTLSGATRPNAIMVPQRAVLEGPQGKFVYVVNKESKAEPHPVVVGDWVGDMWVIQSGLASGDQVIVDGVLKIGPGAPVKIADPAAAKAAPGAPGAPAGKGDAPKADAGKADPGKAEAPKADAAKADASKADAPKVDATKAAAK